MTSTAKPASPVQTDFLLLGGGIAALTAARTLRNEGAEGSITILCAESEYPYNRPPLTKGIITGELSPDQLLLAPPEHYLDAEIDIRLRSAARSVEPVSHTVLDQTGVTYQYGKLLIATGARPYQLAVPGVDLAGIFSFRFLADAIALRKWVVANPGPVAIVGTSFIAMELATSLTCMGIKVILIDRTSTVFPRIQSAKLSRYFLERCQSRGINVLLDQSIRRIHGKDRVSGLETTSGEKISCQTVIVAIGADPQTDFLGDSGLQISDGVLVDEFLQTNVPDIFAAGDVACYLDNQGNRHRSRHWENARSQGRVAAKNMLGQRIPYSSVLQYFCDFLDFSFTVLGSSDGADMRIGRGNLESKSFAEFYICSDRITGLFSTGRPAEETEIVKTLIRDRVDIRTAAARLADPAADLEALARETVLILQGGGALGAFECGIVRAMDEAAIVPNIVGGVSIGAINGCIIAGNPHTAAATLEEFWDEITVDAPKFMPAPVASTYATGATMAWGIPEFFRPRWLAPGVRGEYWPHQWTSLYDASPLKDLLCKYVDFSKLSQGPVRLIISAVDVELGEQVFFDSHIDELTPDHILASCSLPPVFAWTTIDGRHYWDGGIISNSPLEHILIQCGADNKRILVADLFPGERPLPTDIAEVLTRHEEIIYSERIRNDGHIRELVHDFQALVAEVMRAVSPDDAERFRQNPRYVDLMSRGGTTSITRIVRDGSSKESLAAHYDFSTQAINRHKQEGYLTAQRLLASLIQTETSGRAP